ncbi:MAG TPA: two-component regulator propeller domain-containing protein [Roseateles sp.]
MNRSEGQGRRRLLPALLLATLLSACPPLARAADPPLQIAQYAHTSWTARDGANLGPVFAIAQTADGYLWIAGANGLFRFDGLRFMPWQPPDGQALPSGPYSLLAARDGTLWIGTFGGLSSWDGKAFTRRHPQIATSFVTSLLEDRDGTIWAGLIGEAGRLCAVKGGKVQCFDPQDGFGSRVWSLVEDRAGTLWVGADSGIWRWKPGTPRRYPVPGQRVGDLTTTADGQLLAGMEGRGLRQLVGEQFQPHRFQRAGRPGEWLAERDIKSNKLLRDRDGGLWIGTEGLGLIHVKDGQADGFTRAQGLSGNIACSLFEDREGNVWYGSERGIDRFRKLAVATISKQQGLPDEVSRSVVATTDGSVWVATNEGLARWKDGGPRVYNEGDGLPDAHVHSQYQDADGRLWVSTAKGLAHFANERFVAVDGGPSDEIYAITGDAAGNLWLSGNKGLAHLQHGRFIDNLPWSSLGRKRHAQIIIADRGGLWMSFWDGSGVSYFKDGRIEATHTFAHKPGHGTVSGLRLDAEGAVWAATGASGLLRIKDGAVTKLTVASGLPCDITHWSTLDDRGALWLYTACGLVQLAREDLAAWVADPRHRVTPRVWGAADGVPLTVTPPGHFNPPAARRPDGKLWFVSGAELQVIDPANMPANPVPPPVHVEALVADHRPYAAAPGLRLPPLARDISIEFAALTLVDPKSTRFRYRLDGHDHDWQEVVDRRQASYTNLPPGDYRFRVKAANNSGVWSEQGAQFDFSIAPAVYQTTWFRAGGLVLAIGLAWSGFQLWLRLRIRRLQRQFEATLEARVAERTRIARDLHDTLLQHFHGLLLQFQAALNLLPDRPRESRQILRSAIDRAAEAVTEGRDAVHGLRTLAAETISHADAVRSLAKALADEAGHAASAQVDIRGTPQSLHPLVRDESLRIVGEALRNAFHHADAKRIDVEVIYEARQWRIRVRDDGKGIEPEVLRRGEREGHFGLDGMRERAALVGGQLTVRSGLHQGTEVELGVPAARAYSQPAPARWWLPSRKFLPREIGR